VWFKLVEEAKAKYSTHNDDVHNLNESGFQISVISTIKVITGSERHTRPDLIQPGDRK